MNIKTHFEIGKDDNGDTHPVFTSLALSECLVEWQSKQYTQSEGYFIDVWEQAGDEPPYPKANIKIEEWIFLA